MPLTVLIWNGMGMPDAVGFLAIFSSLTIALGYATERRVKLVRRTFRKLSSIRAFRNPKIAQ